MLRTIYIILLLATVGCTNQKQEEAWQKVRKELETIREQAQRYRKPMDSIGRLHGWRSEAVEQLYDQQRKLDSINLRSLEQIIDHYGYPTREHVGELSIIPFEVIEHSPEAVMISYLEIILGAGANGDIPMRRVALFHDRVLLAQRQPQEYGTQIWIDFVENQKTGERYDSIYLWPVRNYADVDNRRLRVGLDSMAIHLRNYNIDPSKGYTLKKTDGAPL